MAFSFLKPKPASTPAADAARQRAAEAARPKVIVGNVGVPEPLGGPVIREMQELEGYAADAMYKKLRRPLTSTETRVGGAAVQWMLSLPRLTRPMECAKAYPHVVNHLAGWWDSPEALASYFDDLLRSPRKRRAGFPAPIRAELDALFAYAREQGLVS